MFAIKSKNLTHPLALFQESPSTPLREQGDWCLLVGTE